MKGNRWFNLLGLSVVAVLLAVLLLAHLRFYSSQSLLPLTGSSVERLAGLVDEVVVHLDGRGVPYVRATNQLDLWFTQGYLHARERFFDMEMARRISTGRLAELLGASAVALDRKCRICQVPAAAKRQAALLSGEELEVVEAYTAGINAALRQHGRWIAPELWLLAADPEPWTIEDSLAVGVFIQFNISWAMGDEIIRAVQLSRLGIDRATDLWAWTPEQRRDWIPPIGDSTAPLSHDDAITPRWDGIGSNAWVLAGSKTASGRPLLANDPHLGIPSPRVWYAIDLQCPGYHVSGVSVPGAPGVHIGHNERVAWGLTMLLLDDQDLFSVSLDETGTMELIDGSLQPLRTVKEEIAVRLRQEPVLLKVQLSKRGPIVRSSNQQTLALAWTGQQGPSQLGAFLRMGRARSVHELAGAWHGVPGPAMNLLAADVDGHIMHQVIGMVPERGKGAGRLPAPGHDSQWSWQGLRPLAANPKSIDPDQGFLANANHDLFAEGDYPMSSWFATDSYAPWRVRRIKGALARRDDWDITGSLELQGDVLALRAHAVLRIIRQELEEHGGPTAQALLAWDGRMVADQLAPHLYSALMRELAEQIAGDEARQAGLMPPYLRPELAVFLGASTDENGRAFEPVSPFRESHVLRLLGGGMDDAWWDDLRTNEVEDRQKIVSRTLDRLDRHSSYARWGAAHPVRIMHPFRSFPLLGVFLDRAWSRGPYPAPGESQTINAFYSSVSTPYVVSAIPSMRFIADVGDWDQTVLALAVGQSGRPWSAHYDDQIDAWLKVRPVVMPFSRAAIERAAQASLRLRPPQGL